MNAIRNILIGAGIIAGFLIVSEMDYRTEVAKEQEKLERLSSICAKKKQSLVQDANGNFMCAPAIVLSMPVRP